LVFCSFDQRSVPPDGVSRSGPPASTAPLIALAAGRNPTDITLPTGGTEAVDPRPGSHEEPAGTRQGPAHRPPMREAERLRDGDGHRGQVISAQVT
jgi:hypothetical protein